jgi:hypothetical protein
MTSIYTIPAEWGALLQEIDEAGGEFTPEIEEKVAKLVTASKESVSAAVLAKRSIELRAETALAQAEVFQREAETCKGMAAQFQAQADRIGAALAPVLEMTGKVQTPAGTAYVRKNAHWSFELANGAEFFMLPQELWRQRDPELNKTALKELAEKNELPKEILAMKSETITACLKKPTPTKKGKPE